ncbi:MAG TPA: alpha-glucosidase/alpha-galactosidase [Prolixibacteraceae bacterium]|nr:alpha-glucosidase/alpha-galactosidase [Prolixibacteraceae bacterium]
MGKVHLNLCVGGIYLFKIVFIGSGSALFFKKLLVDILSVTEFQDAEISLVDVNNDRLQISVKIANAVISQKGNKAKLEYTTKRREVLQNADYVVCMIKIGGYDVTKIDYDIPFKYGIFQTMTDTCGIGAISRALRTIPEVLNICRDICDICPDAYFFNYTNPMSMICSALEKSMPSLKVFGLCHSVQHTAKQFSKYLDIPETDITYWVAGINHMSWYLSLRYKGENLYPKLISFMNNEWDGIIPSKTRNGYNDRVRFDVLRRTGYFVTESSPHMSELFPYILKRKNIMEEYGILHGQHLLNLENQIKGYNKLILEINNGNIGSLDSDGFEYLTYIIQAIELGRKTTCNINVYNNGLIGNLPLDCCVEVPCLIDSEGIHPCKIGNLPSHLAAMNMSVINLQQLAVEAILTGNRDRVYHAVMMDPNVSSVLTLDEVWKMTDELLEAHRERILACFRK